jgi:hypothetical protein
MPGMISTVNVRAAQASDAGMIASIYNEGIAECSIYVARGAGQGVGSELCQQLAEESVHRGFYKLLGKVFLENLACVRMVPLRLP